MAAASMITTTYISKSNADEPIMIHGRDATVALYDLIACFYHHLFGPACPFVQILLYAKQVVEEQAIAYPTTDQFYHNIVYKVTSKIISGVQEFFQDVKTDQQLDYGLLPGTPKFTTYLQLIGMGISQVPLPIAPPEANQTPARQQAHQQAHHQAATQAQQQPAATSNKKARHSSETFLHTVNSHVATLITQLGNGFYVASSETHWP